MKTGSVAGPVPISSPAGPKLATKSTTAGGGPVGVVPPVATLAPAYWSNPTLLHNAQQPTGGDVGGSTATIVGNQLIVTPGTGFYGDLELKVTANDGSLSRQSEFTVSVVPNLLVPVREAIASA